MNLKPRHSTPKEQEKDGESREDQTTSQEEETYGMEDLVRRK